MLNTVNLVWQVVGLLMLFCVLLDALACEIRQRRVPTMHIGLLVVLGMAWHGVEMAQPGGGFFSAQAGPAGVLFAGLGCAVALAMCVPLVALRMLNLSQACLAAGVGAFAGVHAVLDVALLGAVTHIVLYTVQIATGPGYQIFLRQLAHALEQLVPGSRGTAFRVSAARATPTALVMTGALVLHGVWMALGLAPIVRI